MKAIILAAGRGKRMGRITEDKPKCLINIDGTPLIEIQIAALKEANVEEIGVVTGYKWDMLLKYGPHEFYNPFWENTNVMVSLTCASAWLSHIDCITSYSDVLYSVDAIKPLIKTIADIAIPYSVNSEDFPSDPESFKIKKGIIYEIGKKTISNDDIEGQFMGVLKTTPHGWCEITRVMNKLSNNEQSSIDVTGILQKVIEENRVSVIGFPYTQFWREFDNEQDLL